MKKRPEQVRALKAGGERGTVFFCVAVPNHTTHVRYGGVGADFNAASPLRDQPYASKIPGQ